MLAGGEDVEQIGGGVAPIAFVDDLAAFAVIGVFECQIDGDGQTGLPGDIAGEGRFGGRKLGLDGEEIDVCCVECVDNAFVCIADFFVGNPEIRAACISLYCAW